MLNDKTFPGYWRKIGFAWNGASGYWKAMTNGIMKAALALAALAFIFLKFELNFLTLALSLVAVYFAAKDYEDGRHGYYEVEHDSSIVLGPNWNKMGGPEAEWTKRLNS
jgi:hypothetical protein